MHHNVSRALFLASQMLTRLHRTLRTSGFSALAVSESNARNSIQTLIWRQQTRFQSSALSNIVGLFLRRKKVSHALVKKEVARRTDAVQILPTPQREAVTAAAEATAAATAETSAAVAHHLSAVYRQLTPEEIKERRKKKNTPAVGWRTHVCGLMSMLCLAVVALHSHCFC